MAISRDSVINTSIAGFEEPEVTRLYTPPGSSEGFSYPRADGITAISIESIHAPGLVQDRPVMFFFRARYKKGAQFSMRLNSRSLFHTEVTEDGENCWQLVVPGGVLKLEHNTITHASSRGEVILSDVAILYTSNHLTITRDLVLDPG